MKISRKHAKSGSTFLCDGELTIYTVAAAKAELLNDSDNSIDPIALDLKHVSELDTAGVQLLLFTKKIMADNNKRIYLKHSNEYVDGVLNNFDVATQFILEQ